MRRYTSDDINFHSFLAARREKENISLGQLGRGLYGSSMMKRIEQGERLPKKLERDRIVARLGISADRYEDYLPKDDYEWWKQRQDIVTAVEEKEWSLAKDMIASYKGKKAYTKVEKQFLEAMRFMILKKTGGSEEELRESIYRAVSYTIPNVTKHFPKKLLLSPQEVNLLIEYVHLYKPSGEVPEKKRRPFQSKLYYRIFNYIDDSCMDKLGKAKVFPKLVYFGCMDYDVNICKKAELHKCLDACNEAVEILRDTRRLYYFVEILEMRERILNKLLEKPSREENVDYKKLLKTTIDWKELFLRLYKEYGLSPYMENFTHLYWETESHCINDVIRIRRHMLGLTQEKLADGVCSVKTLRRIEKRKSGPQMYEVRGLFAKLGLCPEYVRASVITTDPTVVDLHRAVNHSSNSRDAIQRKELLEKLRNCLDLNIPQNKQALQREQLLYELNTKQITKEEFAEKLYNTFTITMPITEWREKEEIYLTQEEIQCLYNFINVNYKNDIYVKLVKRYCQDEIRANRTSSRIRIGELVSTGIASWLGNQGEYEESKRWGEGTIVLSLRARRMRTLARNLYNTLWCNQLIYKDESLAKAFGEQEVLASCFLLSEISKDEPLVRIFETKLNKVK